MGGVDPETLMAAGYALFLIVVALGLDLLARHSQRRSDRYRTGGFDFHTASDAWICPEGERLERVETDHEMRVARYRARAHVCNDCRLKEACTDSDEGREIATALDGWPHSEAGRFHRGLSVVIVLLGGLVIAAGAALNHGAADLAVLGAAMLVAAFAAIYLLADLRMSPAEFPWREGELSR